MTALFTFSICGAPKAGTTALYGYLQQHPDVCMSQLKETNYFQFNYKKGPKFFEKQFAHHNGEKAVGEASPGNMAHELSATRIKESFPDAQIVCILRNPLDRIFSQYWFRIHRGDMPDTMTFSQHIRAGMNESDKWAIRNLYLGEYAGQIERFDSVFPREKIHLMVYEEYRENPEQSLTRLCEFLGVDYHEPTATATEKNVTRYPSNPTLYQSLLKVYQPVESALRRSPARSLLKLTSGVRAKAKGQLMGTSKPEMNNEDRELLFGYYKKSVEKLSERLDRDMISEWGFDKA